jgi:beta-exotoxin I transport system ATP-binding protein
MTAGGSPSGSPARGGVDRPWREELAEQLQVILDRPTHELSKGNRQKLGLVLAFMHRPQLLVLDEPTSGLDPLMQDEFHRLLRETVTRWGYRVPLVTRAR